VDDSRRASSFQWRPSHNGRPAARRTVDEEFAVDQEEALSHSSEPEAWPTWFSAWIETTAIVLHSELKSATGRTKLDLDRAGA
jgi:hypothetical protein